MHVISQKALRDFWDRYPDAEQPLKAWYRLTKSAHWQSPADVKAQFRSTGFVGNNRVVFNIAGNQYRLIVAVRYRIRRVFIRFVGTHRQYDAVDAKEV